MPDNVTSELKKLPQIQISCRREDTPAVIGRLSGTESQLNPSPLYEYTPEIINYYSVKVNVFFDNNLGIIGFILLQRIG